MGAIPSKLTDTMFMEVGGDAKKALDIFRSWADSNAIVEASLELRLASLDIQVAFASLGHFLFTKKMDHYKATLLYIDIAKKSVEDARIENKDVKDSFRAVIKYLQIRTDVITRRIQMEKEAKELVEMKGLELKFAAEDAEALERKIEELKRRMADLRSPSAKGGAYRFPRKMSRGYCRKTACRRMGFTQRASCRPYKNCYRRTQKKRTAA